MVRVLKIRLSDFTLVDTMTLSVGEDFLYSAVLDTAKGYAYFATATAPGQLVKKCDYQTSPMSMSLNSIQERITLTQP